LNSKQMPNPSARARKYANCEEGLTPGKFFVKPLIVRLCEYRLAFEFVCKVSIPGSKKY